MLTSRATSGINLKQIFEKKKEKRKNKNKK